MSNRRVNIAPRFVEALENYCIKSMEDKGIEVISLDSIKLHVRMTIRREDGQIGVGEIEVSPIKRTEH